MTKLVDERDTMDNALLESRFASLIGYIEGILGTYAMQKVYGAQEALDRIHDHYEPPMREAIATSQQAGSAAASEPVGYLWPTDVSEVLPNDGWCVLHANDADMSDAVPVYLGSAAVEPTEEMDELINRVWAECLERHGGIKHRKFAYAMLAAIGSAVPALAVPRSPLGHATESPAEAVQRPAVGTCGKCGGLMRPGKAIAQTWGGVPDFIGGEAVTMSLGGPGRLIDCLKCAGCGWSVTPAASGNPATARSDAPK